MESFKPKKENKNLVKSIAQAAVVYGALAGGGAAVKMMGKMEPKKQTQEEIYQEDPGHIAETLKDAPIDGFDSKYFTREQLTCLTDNLYHEARGEPIKGRYGVVFATLERVLDKKYPKTICGVVHQPWQFSWTKDQKILAAPINPKEYLQMSLEIYELARGRTLEEASVEAGLRAGLPRGAIYYKDAKFTGSEKVQKFFASLQRVTQIGTHEFFVVHEKKNQKIADAGKTPAAVPVPRPRPKNL